MTRILNVVVILIAVPAMMFGQTEGTEYIDVVPIAWIEKNANLAYSFVADIPPVDARREGAEAVMLMEFRDQSNRRGSHVRFMGQRIGNAGPSGNKILLRLQFEDHRVEATALEADRLGPRDRGGDAAATAVEVRERPRRQADETPCGCEGPPSIAERTRHRRGRWAGASSGPRPSSPVMPLGPPPDRRRHRA